MRLLERRSHLCPAQPVSWLRDLCVQLRGEGQLVTHSFKLRHGGLIETWEERYKNWTGNEGGRFLHLCWQLPCSGVPPAAAQGGGPRVTFRMRALVDWPWAPGGTWDSGFKDAHVPIWLPVSLTVLSQSTQQGPVTISVGATGGP